MTKELHVRYVSQICVCLQFVLATTFCQGQIGDFNEDGTYDCADIDQLYFAARNGPFEAKFDLSGDGKLEIRDDVDHWLEHAGNALGYEIPKGDINFDGIIDARDVNIYSINYVTRTDPNPRMLGWCQGDLDGNGISDSTDRGQWASNWLQGRDVERRNAVLTHDQVDSLAAWRSEEGVVVGSNTVYDIIAIPQTAPDGFLATIIAFRQKDPANRFTAVEAIEIRGDSHQAWSSIGWFTSVEPVASPLYDPVWSQYDTHLLWEPRSFGIYSFEETNDKSDPTKRQENLPQLLDGAATAQLGFGNTRMSSPSDTAAIEWDANVTFLEFAKIVTPARMADTGKAGKVFLRLNLHSANANSLPVAEVGFIGVDEPFQIPFFGRPCDVDTDGDCDLSDWDLMIHALGKMDPPFDIDQDGRPISTLDLRLWSTYAESVDVTPPVLGDTNFDFRIDQHDLNSLALNWGQPGNYGWVGGDFDGNGVADAADLNWIALGWQFGADTPAPVPEPGAGLHYLLLFGFSRRIGTSD